MVAVANAVSRLKECGTKHFGDLVPERKPLNVESTYCYLMALADHRDSDTWGIHLLDLAQQGLKPLYTIADAGKGLRAGQAEAWPGIPCHGDVFHLLRLFGQLAFYFERRAILTYNLRSNNLILKGCLSVKYCGT